MRDGSAHEVFALQIRKHESHPQNQCEDAGFRASCNPRAVEADTRGCIVSLVSMTQN